MEGELFVRSGQRNDVSIKAPKDNPADWEVWAPPKQEGSPVNKTEKLKGFAEAGMRFDEHVALDAIPEAIRAALAHSMGRVSDFFRAMDGDESGSISRKEFVCALQMLGLPSTKQQLGAVFDCFDVDGSGEVSYSELERIIQRGERISPTRPRRMRVVPPSERKRFASVLNGYALPPAPPVYAPYTPITLHAGGLPPLTAWQHTTNGFDGVRRGSGRLALITMPSSVRVALESNPGPGEASGGGGGGGARAPRPSAAPSASPGSFPVGVLRSELLSKTLIGQGYNIIAFESHAAGASWSASGADTYAAYLVAALDHIARHPQLRYCQISLFAHGLGSSATLAALSKKPAAFEQRLKALVLSAPVPAAGLVDSAPYCTVPTLLLTPGSSAAGGDDADDEDEDESRGVGLARAIADALDYCEVPCELVVADDAAPGEMTTRASRPAAFDPAEHLSDHPGAVDDFLGTHLGKTMPSLSPRSLGATPRSNGATPRRTPRNGSPRLPPIA